MDITPIESPTSALPPAAVAIVIANTVNQTRARLALLLRRRIGSQREDKDFDDIIRLKTIQITCFSFFGLATMLFVSFFCWFSYSNKKNSDAYYDDIELPTKLLSVLYMGQAAMTASTIVTILLIAQKYQLLLVRRRAEWSGTDIFEIEGFRGVAVRDSRQRDYFLSSYNFWRSPLARMCALEILVHAIHPFVWMASFKEIPTVPASYDYFTINIAYKIFQLFMFARLYLLFQLVEVLNPGYRNRFEIVNNDAELMSVGFHIDGALTLKLIVHQHPLAFFLAVSVLTLIAFGFGVFSVERVEGPVGPLVNYILPEDAFWWAYATMRGVGYGEFSPRTIFGRLIAAACVLCGIVAMAIFSGVLVTKIQLQKELKQALEYLHTSQTNEHMQHSAAMLIQTAWRLMLHKRKEKLNVRKRELDEGEEEEEEGVKKEDAAEDNAADDEEQKKKQAGEAEKGKEGGEEGDDEEKNKKLKEEEEKRKEGNIKFDFKPGHKADLLYFSIKHFRDSRKSLNAALTQSEDVVMNTKVESVLALTQALRTEVEDHQRDFARVERMIATAFDQVAKNITKYQKMGFVPV